MSGHTHGSEKGKGRYLYHKHLADCGIASFLFFEYLSSKSPKYQSNEYAKLYDSKILKI